LMDIMSLIAKDTVDCESKLNGEEIESRQYKKNEFGSLSMDSKICKEIVQLSELILTRRGAQYEFHNADSIWEGQKEILCDWCLAAQCDFVSTMLARANDESHSRVNDSYLKDGENSGKNLSRALMVNKVHFTHIGLTGNASLQVPRRLRKLRGGPSVETAESLFSLDMTLPTLQEHLSRESYPTKQTTLEAYEALVDGLCGLSCHPNINVRGFALSVTSFAYSYFGWLVKHCTSRLLNAISLDDEHQKGVCGIPSCSQLVQQINSQGKRSRLAEVVKGVAKIVALPKVLKQLFWGECNRFDLAKTLCGTQKLFKLLPAEEVPKVVTYINSIFLTFRSKIFSLPRNTKAEQTTHESCLEFLLNTLQLQEGNNGAENSGKDNDAGAMHWRDRLVAAWFILQLIDEQDFLAHDTMSQVWLTCFKLIEEEQGQPLQRVSLGLLGRLVTFATSGPLKCSDLSALQAMTVNEKFLRAFGNALVFDHKEDHSVGGGHSAQWSSGVEEIIRDATANVAQRTLFPNSRTGLKSRTFKLNHSQLIEGILLAVGHDSAKATSNLLLEFGKELAGAPPSEDQRNQQVTAAEIFGGVARALIRYSNTEEERNKIWKTVLLPFLDEAIVKMPPDGDLMPAFFDACRYGIHQFPVKYFYPLLKWSVMKAQNTLWQHVVNAEESNEAESAIVDRFALQSKVLFIVQAVITELNNDDNLSDADVLTDIFKEDNLKEKSTEIDLEQSWKYVNENLTPCLLNAISHPYDKCRDAVASSLFRMCYCHRGSLRKNDRSSDRPGTEIINQFSNIRNYKKYSFKERMRALGTARKFISCCIHWGDSKYEYSEFIIPLLPLAFESLQPKIEGEVSLEDRGIEIDLVKGYRYVIADISSSCVACYGAANDITCVLDILKEMSSHDYWQIRQAVAHFLRCFQGAHKFFFSKEHNELSLSIAISLLADDRREVSMAATSALTGIFAMYSADRIEELVREYIKIANKVIVVFFVTCVTLSFQTHCNVCLKVD